MKINILVLSKKEAYLLDYLKDHIPSDKNVAFVSVGHMEKPAVLDEHNITMFYISDLSVFQKAVKQLSGFDLIILDSITAIRDMIVARKIQEQGGNSTGILTQAQWFSVSLETNTYLLALKSLGIPLVVIAGLIEADEGTDVNINKAILYSLYEHFPYVHYVYAVFKDGVIQYRVQTDTTLAKKFMIVKEGK